MFVFYWFHIERLNCVAVKFLDDDLLSYKDSIRHQMDSLPGDWGV